MSILRVLSRPGPLLAVRVKPIGRANGMPVMPVTETARLLAAKRSSVLLFYLISISSKWFLNLKQPKLSLSTCYGNSIKNLFQLTLQFLLHSGTHTQLRDRYWTSSMPCYLGCLWERDCAYGISVSGYYCFGVRAGYTH